MLRCRSSVWWLCSGAQTSPESSVFKLLHPSITVSYTAASHCDRFINHKSIRAEMCQSNCSDQTSGLLLEIRLDLELFVEILQSSTFECFCFSRITFSISDRLTVTVGIKAQESQKHTVWMNICRNIMPCLMTPQECTTSNTFFFLSKRKKKGSTRHLLHYGTSVVPAVHFVKYCLAKAKFMNIFQPYVLDLVFQTILSVKRLKPINHKWWTNWRLFGENIVESCNISHYN